MQGPSIILPGDWRMRQALDMLCTEAGHTLEESEAPSVQFVAGNIQVLPHTRPNSHQA